MYIFGYNFSKICTCIYGQKTSKEPSEGEVGDGAFDMGPYYCHHEYLIYIFTKQVI